MANDASLPLRRAVLTAQKADTDLTAIVAATSIYPQAVDAPVWPFTRYGGPTVVPIQAACVDGCEVTFAVHGFAKPRYDGAAMIETAEDHAARLGAALARALDKKALDLDGGGKARVRWTGSQLLVDGAEADAFHTVQNFRARVIA